MKKWLAVLLALVLMTVSAASVFADASAGPDGMPGLAGGWYLPEEIAAQPLPGEAQAAFEKALEGFTGNKLEPLALLGTQVVAGVNYSILCRSTLVTAVPVVSLQVVTVYADLAGGASVRNIAPFDLDAYTDEKNAPAAEMKAGGWQVNAELVRGTFPEEVGAAFDKALEHLVGVSYEPVLHIGSQVVAGMNYAVLCKAAAVVPDPVPYLTVAVVYANWDGTADFSSFHYIDPGEFNA